MGGFCLFCALFLSHNLEVYFLVFTMVDLGFLWVTSWVIPLLGIG